MIAGLFFWRLFRDDPHTSKALTRSALALAGYGTLIFVFWYVRRGGVAVGFPTDSIDGSLSYNIYQLARGPSSL